MVGARPPLVGVTPDPAVHDLLDEVVDASVHLPTTIWGFGIGGFLHALLRAGVACRRPELVDVVRERVVPALSRPGGPSDHLIPVDALLALSTVDPSVDVGPTCERWTAAVTGAWRPVPNSPRVHRPDLDRWHTAIWVDCMHTDGPGLARLGHLRAAVTAAEEYSAALQRNDGLFQHGYDVVAGMGNGVAWGRGQAWAMQGLIETLEQTSSSRLAERLEDQLSALARHEDDGRWHTVVDDPRSPIENSVAAYAAWLVPHAIRVGVDPAHAAMAFRARESTTRALVNGVLPTSDATPVGRPIDYYSRPVGAHPWGQAPVLHHLLDRLSMAALDDSSRKGHP